MKDVVIFAGTAIGSVLALAEEIKQSYDVKIIVVCLKSNHNVRSILELSKFIDEVVVLNYSNDNEFFNFMKDWTHKKEFVSNPIVYFTTDLSCHLVNLYRDWFDQNYHLILPSSEIINTYTQKGKAEKDAEINGLLCPKSIVIESEKEAILVEKEFNFPVILKPLATYDNNKTPFKTKKVNKDEFLKIQLNLLKRNYLVICQEFIPGDDDKSYFYLFNRDENGVINYVIGRKIVQSPPQAGIMAKGVVEENNELSTICANFLNKINYIGIGGIEFKEYNGRYYFIEMSTRLEGFFKIGSLAGVPLGKIAFEKYLNESSAHIYKPYNGTQYVDLIPLLASYKKQKKYSKLIIEIVSLFMFRKECLNVYSKQDRRPFWKMLKSYL